MQLYKLYCIHAYKKLVPSIHRLWSKTMELFYVFCSNTLDKSRGINMPFLCELIRSSIIQLQLETSAWSASQNWFRFTFTEHLEQSGYIHKSEELEPMISVRYFMKAIHCSMHSLIRDHDVSLQI